MRQYKPSCFFFFALPYATTQAVAGMLSTPARHCANGVGRLRLRESERTLFCRVSC